MNDGAKACFIGLCVRLDYVALFQCLVQIKTVDLAQPRKHSI